MGNFAGIAPEQCPVSALSDTFQLSNEQLEAVFRRARSDSPVVYLGGNEEVNLVLDVGALLNRSTEASPDTSVY